MERTYIKDIVPSEEEILLQAWVHSVRDTRKMVFLVLRDYTGIIQVSIDKETMPEMAEMVAGLKLDCVVSVVGKALHSDYVKLKNMEVWPSSVEVLSVAEDLPINKESKIDSRLAYRWVDLRSEKNLLMLKVQTAFTQALRDFLLKDNFIEIHTPKLISAASESGSQVFEVKYFEDKAYLAQSPQFYKQLAMAAGLEKVFTCGAVFRAENSFTNRHATEFTGFDIEFSFIKDFNDVMKLEEELLTYALSKVKEQYGDEIKAVFDVDVVVPTLPFPRLTLDEVYERIAKYGHERTQEEQLDLSTPAEKLLGRYCVEEFGHEFVFVTDFKKDKRAFYHMRENDIPQGYDLIWKGVEITTGAQREHRYDILASQAKEAGLDKDVEFYLEFFKYGCPPHGGFGLGLDRIQMLLLNLSTIKESQFIFRGPNNIAP